VAGIGPKGESPAVIDEKPLRLAESGGREPDGDIEPRMKKPARLEELDRRPRGDWNSVILAGIGP
jgi:hypothetical protein